jgi:hypothetical protein
MPGKRVKFDPEDFIALDQLARERHMTTQQLAEAFHDLLKKHGRAAGPKEASAVLARPPHARRQRASKKRKR